MKKVWVIQYIATARGVFKVYLYEERDDALELFNGVTGRFRETLGKVNGSAGDIAVDNPKCFHWHGYSSGDIIVTLGVEEVI